MCSSDLVERLESFEAETGWKLRVLTQFDRTPGRAVKDFWGLDNKSLLLIADARGGNLLNFNVGDAFYEFMPRTFWIELQTRYGNQFFVRDNGENQAIVESLYRSEEHTSELQSLTNLVCRLLLEKKKTNQS